MLLFPETNTMQQHKPAGIFQDDKRNYSMMRVISAFLTAGGLWFGYIASTKPVAESGTALQAMFTALVFGIGGKNGQKLIEMQGAKKEPPREEVP